MRERTRKIYYSIKEIFPAVELKVILTLFLIISSLVIFLVIAYNVSGGSTKDFDEYILRSLRQPGHIRIPIGPKWLPEVMRDITSLGGGAVIFLITLITVGYLVIEKHYTTLWLTISAILGGITLDLSLKEFFGRDRPFFSFQLMNTSADSFPSGHSMMAVVVYLTLAVMIARLVESKKTKIFIISCALFLSFLIGISRVYLGVHYPTDVLAGWLAGLAWVALFIFLNWYIRKYQDLKLSQTEFTKSRDKVKKKIML